MTSDSNSEERVRSRAYELYTLRTRTGMGAVDDWLQAEAEVRLANETTVETSGGEGSWTNVEPFLKWGAVAYGLGFVTVMLHTRRIGIPVIQLVDRVALGSRLIFYGRTYSSSQENTRRTYQRALAPAVPGSIEIGNLTWVSGATAIMDAPGRQAMVDCSLVPTCPSKSMTSVVAINCVVASLKPE